MTTAAIEQYLAARKTVEAVDGIKPTATKAKATPKLAKTGKRKMDEKTRAKLARLAKARWRKAKAAGKTKL